MTIGERVKQLRERNKLTYRELSKLTGLDPGGLCQLEKNKASTKSVKNISPKLNTIVLLCKGLNYDITLFLTETGYLDKDRICLDDEEIELLKIHRISKELPDYNFNEEILQRENTIKSEE